MYVNIRRYSVTYCDVYTENLRHYLCAVYCPTVHGSPWQALLSIAARVAKKQNLCLKFHFYLWYNCQWLFLNELTPQSKHVNFLWEKPWLLSWLSGKGACCQTWHPKFCPRESRAGKIIYCRKLSSDQHTPVLVTMSTLSPSTHMLMYTHTYTLDR